MNVCMYVCMYVYIYTCMYVCMHVCMYGLWSVSYLESKRITGVEILVDGLMIIPQYEKTTLFVTTAHMKGFQAKSRSKAIDTSIEEGQ